MNSGLEYARKLAEHMEPSRGAIVNQIRKGLIGPAEKCEETKGSARVCRSVECVVSILGRKSHRQKISPVRN